MVLSVIGGCVVPHTITTRRWISPLIEFHSCCLLEWFQATGERREADQMRVVTGAAGQYFSCYTPRSMLYNHSIEGFRYLVVRMATVR